jgi:hypothetical protein
MTASQSADISMFRNVKEYLDQESIIIATSPTLQEDYDDFTTLMSQLEEKVTGVKNTKETPAADKSNLKSSIAEKAALMFSFLKRHAIKTNDETLKKNVESTATTLKQLSDIDFIAFCQQAETIFRTHEVVLTKHDVSTEQQADLLTQLSLFKSLKPQVKLSQSKRSVAKEDVGESVKNIKSFMTDLLDVSVKTVDAKNPEFVRQYELNRVRREPAKSVTQILFTVKNEVGDLQFKGADIVIPELSFIGKTDSKGQLAVKTGNIKSLVATIMMEGMETQKLNFSNLERSSTTTAIVKLKSEQFSAALN